MPNVDRNCTYRQSLDYLRHNLAGTATAAELDAILGESVRRVLGMAAPASWADESSPPTRSR
jgi:hypothetical protein